jgi:hypothetical protein
MITARRGTKSPNRSPDVHELSPATRPVRDGSEAAGVWRSVVQAAARPAAACPSVFTFGHGLSKCWPLAAWETCGSQDGSMKNFCIEKRPPAHRSATASAHGPAPKNFNNRFALKRISRRQSGTRHVGRQGGVRVLEAPREGPRAGSREIPGHTGCLRGGRHFAPKGCRRARGPAAGRASGAVDRPARRNEPVGKQGYPAGWVGLPPVGAGGRLFRQGATAIHLLALNNR